jgi:hypothetical protein
MVNQYQKAKDIKVISEKRGGVKNEIISKDVFNKQ